LFLQLLLCSKNKFLATSFSKLFHLHDEPLEEGRFVFECILAKPMVRVDSALVFKRLYCAFVWLKLFPGNSVSCYKINCSFLVTCIERLHSRYLPINEFLELNWILRFICIITVRLWIQQPTVILC